MVWQKLRIPQQLTGEENYYSTGVDLHMTVVFDDAVTPFQASYRCSDGRADDLVTKLNSVDYPE